MELYGFGVCADAIGSLSVVAYDPPADVVVVGVAYVYLPGECCGLVGLSICWLFIVVCCGVVLILVCGCLCVDSLAVGVLFCVV